MNAPARLLGLRLQGFKSFAERTVVEFGPGISAVVGPNGSGKSNLADGLRWALGEQGRALRSRKSEDVIWAGSDRRSALGMADVTLILDNADGLLPVDYSVLELGRRLYRSGENDYLLNRQRVRLRDLVDLLDSANLADNAFLFIGQGMVDQALSLRPEERRPLFEEVAGVRRHERRRRKAEDQLVESEANLARVQDILAELRPQARRLAAQAEQQASRETAGTQLAEALLVSAHARWHEAAGRLAGAAAQRDTATREAERLAAALRGAEDAAAAIAAQLTTRAAAETERREAHDIARATLTRLQLAEARLLGDLEAVERDVRRLGDERAAAEADMAAQRRSLALPVGDADPAAQAALADAERSLAEGLARLAELRASHRSQGEAQAAVRQAEAARQADAEASRRRLADLERRLATERASLASADQRRVAASASVTEATKVLAAAAAAEAAAGAAYEAARAAAEELERSQTAALEEASALGARAAAASARLAGVEARLRDDEARWIARSARRRGGRRLDEDLVVEPAFRHAVEAALSPVARAFVVERSVVSGLDGERGTVVVSESLAAAARTSAADRAVRERAIAHGGGVLSDAVRRDPTSAVGTILSRVAWLPDLAACLAIQPDLPPGWSAVPRDGTAIVTSLAVSLGAPEAALDQQAGAATLRAEAARLAAIRAEADAQATDATAKAVEARQQLDRTRAQEVAATTARRRAEEAERIAARTLEAAVREAGWHESQVTRLDADLAAARAAHDAQVAAAPRGGASGRAAGANDDAVAAWEDRVGQLRRERDRLAGEQAVRDAARREADTRRARAEAAIALDEERIGRADSESGALGERAAMLATERDRLAADLTAAASTENRTRAALTELRAADSVDRERLAAADRAVTEAREALRTVEERLRTADRGDLEARLAVDALREQVLVELAGLGDLGLRHLAAAAGTELIVAVERAEVAFDQEADPDAQAESDEAAALEAALDLAAAAWAAGPARDEVPSSQRLGLLRRRFHDLGAANPFAVEEYAEVRARLETLETQEGDLREAIVGTRKLIEELNAMIADQFTSTFRALESAFDRRFSQLFGGGFARLSLTDPSDVAGSGVEIVARPPGKKAQALSMLSGGERALTAVALLFAMLEVRPVPFCVLDEVDAALDEANVGRFSEALRGLAARTQFIVITHNRGTIEAADALYGVTVGDDSVSRVISLRLEEARAIAEQRAGRETAATIG